MAKVIQSDQRIVAEPWWGKIKSTYVGLGMGVAWWVLTALIRRYVVETLACRDLSAATTCVNALSVSGAIAAIVIAVLGTIALIRWAQPRPIVVSLATLVVLWGLGGLESGLSWYGALAGSVVLYGLSYTLFSLVTRIRGMLLSIIVALLLSVGIRLLFV